MHALPIPPRPALWVALLAAALNVLAPLAAYARHVDGLPFEVCSVNGSTAESGTPLPGAPDGKGAHSSRCALCSASGAKLFALTGAASAPLDPRAAAESYPLSHDVPRDPASPYFPAHARAPPRSPVG